MWTKDEIKARVALEKFVEAELGAPVQTSGEWQMYYCPFHTNTRTPALGINLTNGTFKCFACKAHGDIYTWRMLRTNEDIKQALLWYRETLGEPIGNSATWKSSDGASQEKAKDSQAPPSATWQVRGRQFALYSQEQLWKHDSGLQFGLDELFHRRLKPDTIMAWGLGYNPEWVSDDPAQWGITPRSADQKVWLAPGLVIPCEIEETFWYLKIRVFGKNGKPVGKNAKYGKYNQPAGGKGGLFGAGVFQGRANLLLAESEMDAILAWQEGKERFDFASLGDAGKSLSAQWMARLLPYQRIYLAYDQDQAGRNGEQILAEFSQRLVVSPPPFGDLSEFHQLGGDLKRWMDKLKNRV